MPIFPALATVLPTTYPEPDSQWLNTNGRGGNGLTFRWLANLLVTLVGALLLTGLGWIKASLDATNQRVDIEMNDVRSLQAGASEMRFRLDEAEAKIGRLDAANDHSRDLIADLQRRVDIHEDWIQARVHADRAMRKLR